jgi:transcriptional regulator with XRE-family HTH domain
MKKSEELKNLGILFRLLRMSNGFTSAEQFSYENDLNRTAYWRWENGENITIKNFLKLCEIYKVTPKEFFDIYEKKYCKKSATENQIVNEER